MFCPIGCLPVGGYLPYAILDIVVSTQSGRIFSIPEESRVFSVSADRGR